MVQRIYIARIQFREGLFCLFVLNLEICYVYFHKLHTKVYTWVERQTNTFYSCI